MRDEKLKFIFSRVAMTMVIKSLFAHYIRGRNCYWLKVQANTRFHRMGLGRNMSTCEIIDTNEYFLCAVPLLYILPPFNSKRKLMISILHAYNCQTCKISPQIVTRRKTISNCYTFFFVNFKFYTKKIVIKCQSFAFVHNWNSRVFFHLYRIFMRKQH